MHYYHYAIVALIALPFIAVHIVLKIVRKIYHSYETKREVEAEHRCGYGTHCGKGCRSCPKDGNK
jgi:hypothetical protein